jgi:hypothetical protein
MEEPYIEGVATHDGHEPCVGVREDVGEALVVARAGWAIEPRNRVCSGCRRCHDGRKATSPVALARVAGGPRVVGEPVHVRKSPCARTGRSHNRPPTRCRVRAARGRPRPYARDVRLWEVGQPRSTCEAVEQRRVSGCGGGGGLGGWARGTWPEGTASRTQSRVRRVTCAGSCASERALCPT